MNQRFGDQLAAMIAIVLLLGLAGGTYYLAEFSDRDEPRQGSSVAHEPDYFVERLAMIKLNAKGEPVFRMSASRAQHFPDDGSTEFDMPVLVSLDPKRPAVRLSARNARTDREGRATELFDQVRLVREASEDSARLQVDTERITIDSDTEIARTALPVHIVHGATTLTGVGMEFNNAARLFRLDSEVRGVWQAAQRAVQPNQRP